MANSELRRELSLELFLVVRGKHYLGTASGGSFLFALNAWRKFFFCSNALSCVYLTSVHISRKLIAPILVSSVQP